MNTINLNFNEKGKEPFKEGSCFKLKDLDLVFMLSKVRTIKNPWSYPGIDAETYYTLISIKTGVSWTELMSLKDINKFIAKNNLIPLGDNLIFNIKKKDDE